MRNKETTALHVTIKSSRFHGTRENGAFVFSYDLFAVSRAFHRIHEDLNISDFGVIDPHLELQVFNENAILIDDVFSSQVFFTKLVAI